MYRYPFQLLLWATSCSMGFVGCIIEKLRSCSFSFFSLFVPTFLDVWKPYPPSILNSIRPAPLPMLYSKASLPGARHILQSSNPLHAHFNVNFFWFFEQQKLVCFLQTVWFIVSFDVNAYALNIGLPLLMYVQRICVRWQKSSLFWTFSSQNISVLVK